MAYLYDRLPRKSERNKKRPDARPDLIPVPERVPSDKFPRGYGRLRRHADNLQRCLRAYTWLAFRFDLAEADRQARDLATARQLAETGGVDKTLLPKPSDIAYMKFKEL